MLNGNRDSDRRRGKGYLLDAMIPWGARLWQNYLGDRVERRSLQDVRRRSRLHLVGGVDVVCRVGFREVLAVFRER